MRFKPAIMVLLITAIFADYSLVNIDFSYKNELSKNSFDIVEIDPRFGIKLVATEYDFDLLDYSGIPYDIEIDDMEKYYRERLESEVDLFSTMEMGGYRTFDETVEFLDSLYSVGAGLVTEKVSIGTTLEGNDIWMVKLSKSADIDEDEPEIFLDGLIHAREVITHEILIYYMRWLVDGYGSDPLATYILDNREIYIVPIVNPDGFLYNQETNPSGGGMWRKNRRDNGDGTYGVDLNRNFGYEWGFDDTGSSPFTDAETYRGTEAFSERETQAYRDFANEHEFVTHLNFHSYSAIYLRPWGYDSSVLNPDEFIFNELGMKLGKYNGYPHGDDLLYDANGGTFDWMYGEEISKPKIFSFVPEVGTSDDGFWPSISRIRPLVLSQQWPCIYMSLAAGCAPLFESFVVSDTSGDSSGFPDPDEIIRLHPAIKNAGIADAENVYALCNPLNGISEIIVDSVYIGSIESFMVENSPEGFKIRVASDMMLDSLCEVEIIIRDPDGYFMTDTVLFTVGTPTIIAQHDFEDTSGFGFVTTHDWERGLPTYGISSAHSGDNLFATKLNDEYSNNIISNLTSPEYHIPTDIDIARFSFWHWYSTEADPTTLYDGGNVKLSIEGSPFAVITPMDSYDGELVDHSMLAGEGCFGGNSNGWRKSTFDLTPYIGSDIQIQLDFCADPYVTAPGWYVDDMLIYGYSTSAIVDIEKESMPEKLAITAYPNPFNSAVSIVSSAKNIEIYNLDGTLLQKISNESCLWKPGADIDSGMYLIKGEINDRSVTEKVLYIK